MSKEVEQWITVNGVHIPIFKGGSKEEAIKNFLSKSKQSATGKEKLKNTMSLRNEIKEIFQKNGNVYGYDVNALHDKGYSGTDIQNQINYFRLSPSQAKFREKYFKKQSDDQKSIAKNEDEKDQQIARNQKEADNAKQSENTTKALQTVNPASFNKSLVTAKESRPIADKWRVDDTHTIEDYKARGCACYVSKGGSTVAVDRNGDIISLCKNTNDKMKGRELMAEAVKLGGRKLDSFDGNHEFYVSCGFEPVSYTKFNEKYAPKGWKESGCGREDVVFYRYVGIGKVKNTDLEEFKNNNKPFTGENGYDDAMKYRDKFIK